MTDWRQIQLRIRRARTGPDAAEKLTRLYDKTHDAMVAFELAQVMENSGQAESAVHWYTTAAQRFRRADWKKKAEDALTRLGAPVPVAAPAESAAQAEAEPRAEVREPVEEPAPPEPAQPPQARAAEAAPAADGKKRRRRGRRGGRRRHKHGRDQAAPVAVAAPRVEERDEPEAAPPPPPPPPRPRVREPQPEPMPARPSGTPVLGAGEPALASRMARLDSQLRRLIASPAFQLDEVEQAPAGPGVYLLSDSDQVTHYYVESCQTLRIALAQLVKGRTGGRQGSFSLRPILAKHLGISETRVRDYMKDHCSVRWMQIDEGAAHLAHFAIAVLKPALNE